jgi:hypothetical protein
MIGPIARMKGGKFGWPRCWLIGYLYAIDHPTNFIIFKKSKEVSPGCESVLTRTVPDTQPAGAHPE